MNNNPGYKKLWEKPFLIEQTYKWLLWGYETEFVGKRTKGCFIKLFCYYLILFDVKNSATIYFKHDSKTV